ncbi:MAG: hypothetical protein U0944_02610 [Candidatus Moranbacteria bacterium]|nr:hypothetical protein [Candidatus Moranbacteria bacterium]
MATTPENISPRAEKLENQTAAVPVSASAETQNFSSGLPEKKGIASRLYEGLYKIPGINRIVGKMEIAYNQFWADKNEKKAAQSKGEMDVDDMQIGALDKLRAQIESNIENFKQRKIPGVETFQLELKKLDQQKTDMLNKKDKKQSEFEARDNKVKSYTNKRDAIADRLIGRYDEKLHPMEKELEQLQTCKDRLDLEIAAMGADHDALLIELTETEKQKMEMEESLRVTRRSPREIKKFVKIFEDQLTRGREKIRSEREAMARRKDEINNKIAKVDVKANPYRDKREEFARVKAGRPLKMEVKTRERGKVFAGEEAVSAHTRKESVEDGIEEWSDVKVLVSGWNNNMKGKYQSKMVIDQADFMRVTKLRTDKLDKRNFKKLLGLYYKLKKIQVGMDLNAAVDAFYEENENKSRGGADEKKPKGEDNDEERFDQEVERRENNKSKGEDKDEERFDQEVARRQAAKNTAAGVASQQSAKGDDNDEERLDQEVARRQAAKKAGNRTT